MKTAWLRLLAFAVAGALSASACVIKEGSDDDGEGGNSSTGGRGGTGGTGTGGKLNTGGSTTGGVSSTGGSTGTGGKATGGTTSTGGSAAIVVACDGVGKASSPADSCEFLKADLDGPLGECLSCLSKAGNCCAELRNCYGTEPYNQCGYGGPTAEESEYLCYQDCLVTRAEAGGGVYDPDSDPDECAGLCATAKCGAIGDYTNELIACMHTDCEVECFINPAM